MSSLKLQKRLAASVLKCGKRKIWYVIRPFFVDTSNVVVFFSYRSVSVFISLLTYSFLHTHTYMNIKTSKQMTHN